MTKKTDLYEFIYNGIVENKEALFDSILIEAQRIRDVMRDGHGHYSFENDGVLWYICVMDAVCNIAKISEQDHDSLYFGDINAVSREQIDRLKEINRYLTAERIGI